MLAFHLSRSSLPHLAFLPVAIFTRARTSCPATAKDGSKLGASAMGTSVLTGSPITLCIYLGARCVYSADVSSMGSAHSA
jgi:hypothetical protein